MTDLMHTGLYNAHIRAGGKMVPFVGWELPIQYSSIKEEHDAVRTTAGIFDVSHMGEIFFSGTDALVNVQHLVSNDVGKIKPNRAVYSGLLYPEGTFVDDVLVYRMEENKFMLVVNAANLVKDYAWMKDNLSGDVTCENRSEELTQIAVQGPHSRAIIQKLTETNLEKIRYYRFRQGNVAGVDAIISRTGYTGEMGFELYFDIAHSDTVWDALLEAGTPLGLKPAGLGCRDTLRLEAGMALYGNDIDDSHTALEAGLGWVIKFDKEEFIGKSVLETQKENGLTRSLVGFEITDRGIARQGYPIYSGDRQIGVVTSGTMSITLGKAIGMGYVETGFEKLDTPLEIEVRNKRITGKVVALPFYSRTRS